MTKLFREGKSWLIISQIENTGDLEHMLTTVDPFDYSEFTSAKGINSQQNYILPPSWLPRPEHQVPPTWPTVCDRYTMIVQKLLVDNCLMPFNWHRLYAKSAWTVQGQAGSYHTIHEHGPNSISTILYTAVPPRPQDNSDYTGSVYFVMDGSSYNDTAVPATRVMHINPHPGMLIVFPSFMLHGVYPQSSGLRQTVNIDYHGNPDFEYGLGTAGSTSYN